jgi:transcriptional regulator with PAS, ATPase and Fis domain
MPIKPASDKTIIKTLEVLRRYEGNQTKASMQLGISRGGLQAHIRQAEIRKMGSPRRPHEAG